ncbi:M57 family metalloprotease [Chitinophaga nivalis]|uniref:M57 family metalloprotease n=1 Tax=Chitinophaga nivalis TaxID=2991709 RepID=A0ABT3IJB5_9BACT|nr:M57 family metalloprotease [Chitinophaga nivalis]MCW3466275.1 M57 family metalloprotease [Chitinophaga nivalis]MCW3484034.1 M57 family metalloprotease [Chitinophaga nivalis]
MKLHTVICALTLFLTILSCKKESRPDESPAEVSQETIATIKKLGYSSHGISRVANGYVVEGDIFLSDKYLNEENAGKPTALRIANGEQYRTTNLIKRLPRVITVSVSNLPSVYVTATDIAIARYNALQMMLTFQRVAANGEVNINYASLGAGVLGQSAGFPDASGNPPSPILLNADNNALGSNPDQNYLATVIAHELGHTIGLRHTDYFNRNYSCPWSPNPNEGDAGVYALPIYGTPTTEDPNSWMLACIGAGQNRPFNANDITALMFLYGMGTGTNLIPDGIYKATSVNSGKVMEVYNSSLADMGAVKQATWNGGANQRWIFTYLNNGYYRIKNVNSSRVLDINNLSLAEGSLLIQYGWHDGYNQHWQLIPNSDGSYLIQNRNSKKVLDVFGASTADGADIAQFSPHGKANQRWYLTPAPIELNKN